MQTTKLLFLVPAALFLLSAASCSSSSSEDDPGGGSCPAYGDLCVKIPLSVVKAACTTTPAVSAVPQSRNDSSVAVNTCEYQGPTGGSDIALEAWATCFHDGPSTAAHFYDSTHDDTPLAGETQHDVAGLGDRAFYEEDLPSEDGTLWVLKGSVLMFSRSHHISPPADSALPCLTEIMEQLLAIQ
jgi:hypothetical protein